MIGVLVTGITLLLLWYSRPEEQATGRTTAILKIIQMPSTTPTPTERSVLLTQTVESTQVNTGTLAVGNHIQVKGTSGEGLRVRENPGLGQGVLFIANENEEFEIRDGPRDLDGYTWWLLVSPTDVQRSGWAVSNYLMVVNP